MKVVLVELDFNGTGAADLGAVGAADLSDSPSLCPSLDVPPLVLGADAVGALVAVAGALAGAAPAALASFIVLKTCLPALRCFLFNSRNSFCSFKKASLLAAIAFIDSLLASSSAFCAASFCALVAFAYPGMTNLVYDEIKPNDEWIEANIKGSSKTGNATKDKDGNDLGNAVSSELGEKMFKNYKDNVYGAEQMNASYKRYPQTVDQAGEATEDGDLKLKKGSQKSEKIFKQLESTEKKEKLISEEVSRMMNIVGYKQKTQ